MRKRILIVSVLGLLLVGLGEYVYMTTRDPVRPPDPVACTMEALVCPDGSAVGRGFPGCEFAPCPNQSSFTGELTLEGDAYVLVISTPENGMGDVPYTLPLADVSVATARPLVGRQVIVTGTFRMSNTLVVTTLEAVSDQSVETDNAFGVFAVGETERMGDVQITLEEVVADSRCPSDVQCITAGSVSVRVTLISDTGSEVYTMRSDESPHMFGAYQVSIVEVMPAREVSTQEINPASYRVTFRVEPLQVSPAEEYLRAHIGELSPAQAVLGGVFYVTSVRATGDTTAVVEYEDGHVAFTADVVFTVLPDHTVIVDDFLIRRQ